MGETCATHMTTFTSLLEVVSLAFGGNEDENPAKRPITEDLTQLPTDQYVARVSQLLSGGL